MLQSCSCCAHSLEFVSRSTRGINSPTSCWSSLLRANDRAEHNNGNGNKWLSSNLGLVENHRDLQPSCEKDDEGPGWCSQLVGASLCEPKGYGFDSWSGHMPRLWVQSPVGVHAKGSWSVLLSHINVSLPLCLSPPSPLSKISKHVLGWRFKKKKRMRKKRLTLLYVNT